MSINEEGVTTEGNGDAAAVQTAVAGGEQNSGDQATGSGDASTGESGDQGDQSGGDTALGGDGGDAGSGDAGGAATGGAGTGDESGAPETYGDFELPEGITLDAEYLDSLKATFKEAGLSQEQAQKVITSHAQKVVDGQKEQGERFNQLKQDWLQNAKTDKEIGGDGWDQNLGHARSALKQFGGDELAKLLNDTGLGNHPEIIRVFARVGKLLKEDRPGGNGGGAATEDLDTVSILYPTENQ